MKVRRYLARCPFCDQLSIFSSTMGWIKTCSHTVTHFWNPNPINRDIKFTIVKTVQAEVQEIEVNERNTVTE